jgi:hypothetical protein
MLCFEWRQVLQLLSARQLGAAAAVAAACGDVSLAGLAAGAPLHAMTKAEVAAQLEKWERVGALGHIAVGRRLIYEVLAGQVSVPQTLHRHEPQRAAARKRTNGSNRKELK